MTQDHQSEKKSAVTFLSVPGMKHHTMRKTVQTVCVIIFILLPLFKVVRFDIPHQRFYFFGAELWISEFSIIFFSLMFLMVWIASIAMVYGRIYCGFFCPQMIFSEAANLLQTRIRTAVNRRLYKRSKGTRNLIVIFLFSLVLLPAAVFFSFIFISFFIDPVDLFHRLLAFDIRTAGGIAGASVTLVTLLDFAFLREKFCISICPYGYLQSMLSDKHTLLVNYVDPGEECIGCKNCIRTCPMGIDIRLSNRQIECIHCGECIDACATVRGKTGKESLIFYAWGDSKQTVKNENTWYRKLGLRDGKRVAVLVLMLLYASVLTLFISLRKPVLVHIMPDRSVLYTVDANGMIHNHFRLLASNRGHKDALLQISTAEVQGMRIVGVDQGVKLVSGQTVQQEFDVVAAPGSVVPGLNPMKILTVVTPEQKTEPLMENFFAPELSTVKH